jgi:hypothetical protein
MNASQCHKQDECVLFKQTIHVSAYPIAIAADKMDSRPLGGLPISSVWAKEFLKAMALKFAQLPDFPPGG